MTVSDVALRDASSVWQERFQLATPEEDSVRSYEEGVSLFEIESFVGVLTLLSAKPTMPMLLSRAKQIGSATSVLSLQRGIYSGLI